MSNFSSHAATVAFKCPSGWIIHKMNELLRSSSEGMASINLWDAQPCPRFCPSRSTSIAQSLLCINLLQIRSEKIDGSLRPRNGSAPIDKYKCQSCLKKVQLLGICTIFTCRYSSCKMVLPPAAIPRLQGPYHIGDAASRARICISTNLAWTRSKLASSTSAVTCRDNECPG